MVADLKVESISTFNRQQQDPICLPETFLGWAKGKPQKKHTSYYQDGSPAKLSTHHSMPFKHTASKLPHEDPSLLSPLPLCLQHALCRLFPRFSPRFVAVLRLGTARLWLVPCPEASLQHPAGRLAAWPPSLQKKPLADTSPQTTLAS